MIRITAIILTLFLFACGNQQPAQEPDDSAIEDTIAVEREPQTAYGIYIDSFDVFEAKIRRNENLSDILLKYDVPYETIHELATKSKSIFDVRKIREGQPYKVFCAPDSTNQMRCFVYELNDIDYIVYELGDTVSIHKGEKEVTTEVKTASGIITSSLYNAMIDNGLRPMLALEMSDVYAWQVDFFRIQKQDRFKVIYEERSIDGKHIGYGKILGALFVHNEKEFYAIRFVQDSRHDYFDEEGSSLRKAFLKAPLKFSRISSRYSKRRFHPVLKRYKAHLGTDYAAPTGTPIRAVGDGEVIAASFTSGNGNFVKIRHNSMYTTGYLHMSKRAVKAGQMVSQGDVIGYVGSTGLATGPHLCFRFYKSGEQVDALKVEVPPSKPVKEEYKNHFDSLRNMIVGRLDTIAYPKPEL
jgi:murein DD-endopeptidase MepM/ murein hydrolase activator NlpD